uniref:hyaluronidase-4-like n=1 Tax=Euleptes europaea TaxID=460621 RepID=UPI002541BB82|nr:hyaluronidase-4-like [Euleptes europaea]
MILLKTEILLSVTQQIHFSTWLQISFIWSSALKPTQLPVFQRKPFIAAWNAPTDHCSMRYNVTIDLRMFQIIGSPFARARGQNVTIFYVNRLGYYPWYTPEDVPVNGGLPQNFSLQAHLEKASRDISYYIPDKDFTGLAIIDWEHWRPQWDRNWSRKDIYRRQSRKLISEMQVNISANIVEYLAKLSFEQSAKAFMKETLELGIKRRPKGLWGYYLYPDCHNYNFYDQNYTGSCPESEVLRNNELSWLWNSSAALYPSIGVKKSLGNSENILRFSQFRVNESMRIASMTSHDYALPVFVYTRLDYKDEPLLFLSEQDLVSTIGESAALGAAGIVIWGDMNLTSSEVNCTKVKQFIDSELGFYIINVTRAVEVCSRHLCQNNGRCVRRNWKALDYLHLNPSSFQIKASKHQGFTVRGKPSHSDLQIMSAKFTCHCYQGFKGADCREGKTSGKQQGNSATLLSTGIVVMMKLVSLNYLLPEISGLT